MGLVKTIYNVLGGFYMDYNSTIPIISVHKLDKSLSFFLCIFTLLNFSISKFVENMAFYYKKHEADMPALI